ncbi:MAG: TetR/AcrR family transcriptional regulator [Acidobacteriota bacterium]
MGISERKVREKEVLRRKIIQAARELFAEGGYGNATLRQVAQKIEYSPTTIYLHFENKAELLKTISEETLAPLADTFNAIDEEFNDPILTLKNCGLAYVEFGLRHPNEYRLVFMDSQGWNEESMDLSEEEEMPGQWVYESFQILVQDCIAQGRLDPTDAETLTQVLWAALHGVVSLHLNYTRFAWIDQKALATEVIDAIIRGSGPKSKIFD